VDVSTTRAPRDLSPTFKMPIPKLANFPWTRECVRCPIQIQESRVRSRPSRSTLIREIAVYTANPLHVMQALLSAWVPRSGMLTDATPEKSSDAAPASQEIVETRRLLSVGSPTMQVAFPNLGAIPSVRVASQLQAWRRRARL
jgi:hypothetical protein